MDDQAAKELLDDLKMLSDAGRERYMRKLSKDEVCKVFRLLLQDWDKQQNSRSPFGIHESQNKAVEIGKVAEVGGSEETAIFIKSESPEEVSPRKNLKRKSFNGASQALDVLGDEVHQLQPIVEVATDNNCNEETRRVIPTTEPSTLSVEHKSQTGLTMTNHISPNIPVLPFLLHIPEGDGGSKRKDISLLPPDVRSELEYRFRNTCSASLIRQELFYKLCRRPRPRVNDILCVRHYINNKRNQVKAAKYFTLGGVSRKSAENLCLDSRNPCGYVVGDGGRFAICFVPLPGSMRVGRTWTELEFWVFPGRFRPDLRRDKDF